MIEQVLRELKRHVPFTIFGAITGVIIMIFFRNMPQYCSLNHHNTDISFDGRSAYVPWLYGPVTHFSFDRTRVVPAAT